MKKLLLLGDEAIAQGALDAGISGIFAYPGTPSTEITEYVQRNKAAKEGNVHSTWSVNEKTAMEAALGMSYAGKRAMVCMKHVGLNVAADPFINASITGTNGGLIVTVADDPSMHSSQNEQDSRYYGKFSMIPTLEPVNQQEAYDMCFYGFEMSEKYKVPVLLRITTRLAHSRADVMLREKLEQNETHMPEDLRQFVLLPSIARQQYQKLLDKQPDLVRKSEESEFNIYYDGEDKSRGIITTGIAYNYLMENYPEGKAPNPVLKIGQYPLPRKMIEKITEETDELLIIEEGYPVVEELMRGYLDKCINVKGRLDGTIPRAGELSPNIVGKALGMDVQEGKAMPEFLVGRPPSLCAGCPHIDTYKAINEALGDQHMGNVMADIGCYTLGALKPFETINSCVDMGASVTMAKGLADSGVFPAVAVIGDSTFTHSGITGLLDCVIDRSAVTIFILDNATTAMTGGQTSSAFGKIEDICKGIGVEEEHIRVIEPLKKNHEENVKIMKEELMYRGVSVVIPTRECVITLGQKTKAKKKAKKA